MSKHLPECDCLGNSRRSIFPVLLPKHHLYIFRKNHKSLHFSVLCLYPNCVQTRHDYVYIFLTTANENKLILFSHILYPCHWSIGEGVYPFRFAFKTSPIYFHEKSQQPALFSFDPSFSKPFGTHTFYKVGVEPTPPQLSQKQLPL